ncbi:MAG: hypothetical protein K2K06_06240 [Oscillospiraceae bacterium]|nr:hypothetical protein [Oscillospiraceae bacterium]
MLQRKSSTECYNDWVQELDKEQIHAVLGNNLRMFGEWLVPHRETEYSLLL